MQIVINIPDEQIKKSLEESKYIHEDEGVKGSVQIDMLYTNGQLDFVDVSRKTDFYSCKYKIVPKGHGRLIDANRLRSMYTINRANFNTVIGIQKWIDDAPTIIEADDDSEREEP